MSSRQEGMHCPWALALHPASLAPSPHMGPQALLPLDSPLWDLVARPLCSPCFQVRGCLAD